jgi:hypothetical protein
MALTQQTKSHDTPEAGSAKALPFYQYIVVTGYSQKVATMIYLTAIDALQMKSSINLS